MVMASGTIWPKLRAMKNWRLEKGTTMRARVITSKADPSLTDQWAQLTRDVLIPAARDRDGYAGYVAFYERESGTAVAVTLWETEETEKASDLASTPSREAFADSVGAEIRVDYYDVAAVDVISATST